MVMNIFCANPLLGSFFIYIVLNMEKVRMQQDASECPLLLSCMLNIVFPLDDLRFVLDVNHELVDI